ncbi:M3 family metallopeptidase [Georgenia satyanarayanai]|uniref:M3 family metallopeptidase n=1 Tax=Georgenia satyanarayanai TaxID=860221 RepID=UPI0012643913|nr:M3 family metallopeptidase [Georgenia satyanarayanai]
MTDTTLAAGNPFASPSDLPYELPDFVAVRHEHLRPAMLAGLAEQRAEWEAIATDPAEADVANTLEALERSGSLLRRVSPVLSTLVSSRADDELRELEAELAPLQSAHWDALYLDRRIFDRLEAITGQDLDAETAWLLRTYRKDFIRAGVQLDDESQARLRGLNSRLTTLETEFSQRVVKAMDAGAVHVSDASRLAGLDEGTVAGLAQAAGDRGRDGYLITLQLPTQQALLAQAEDRGLREELFTASVQRGTGVDEASDTRATLLEIARLRAERAQLLGYEHHAAYVAEDGTAGTTTAVNEMLGRLAPPAVANAAAEAEELARAHGAPAEPWDWSFLAEKVRQERYRIDDSVLRPYLELESVLRDGVFHAAHRLFGITLTERPELSGYADGVRVWEVREEDGSPLGLFVGDYYAREGKRGGAWMHNLVDQSHLFGQRPVVVNNLNITRPAPGEPTLLTWDEVITAFHEFGHALHGLFSDVHFPSVSGANVPRDFVEYPSQVNEMWARDPEVLARYARHHETAEPLPTELLDALLASAQYGEGFATTEYLGAALLDQAWHQVTPEEVPTHPDDVEDFSTRALERAGAAVRLVPPRYRSTYFNHTFGGGYDAGYYSYIWSEVLDADTVRWFETDAPRDDDGGLGRAAGQRFREVLLSRGHSADPLSFYRELRGRDADIRPLLERRGLTT